MRPTRSIRELLTSTRQNDEMRFAFALLALASLISSSGCAVVTAVGAVGSVGVSAVSTAGSLAVSGASATLSGASAVARAATPSFKSDDKPAQ